jgi:phosphoribosylamine--glycine ligase
MAQSVLVVGAGGREHALAERLSRDGSVKSVAVCPGNAGTRGAGIVSVEEGPIAYATRERPGLVVVGPEVPLGEGLVDALTALGLVVYGPSRAAAQLETSKVFMKDFAERHGIRTARYVRVTAEADIDSALAAFDRPPVIKASGLCAGKGVTVATSFEEARAAARAMLSGEAFGDAGSEIVIEECLIGQEASIHAICDGRRALMLPAIQDHKRIGEGDTGPNTGGMGTYGPAAVIDAALMQRIESEIVGRALDGMRKDGHPFVGTLFAGLMITEDGEPVLIEFNVRFGDPETQILVNLIDGDFAGLLESAARGELRPDLVSIRPDFGVCVVLAAEGYPASPRRGDVIEGLADAALEPGVFVYHAGTGMRDGAVVSAGGRVLGVTALASDLHEAQKRAYAACAKIRFTGMQFRRDIGHRQLGNQEGEPG